MSYRILFAEDQQLIRESLRILIDDNPSLEIAGTAANGEEALSLYEKILPDIILLDIRMPVLDGLQTARRIREEGWPVKIVLLTTFPDNQVVREALSIGVDGFLLKDVEPALFMRAIESIASGLIVFQEPLMGYLQAVKYQAEGLSPAFLGLTPKDIEYIRHIVNGLGNKEIAYVENCSEGTAKNRISSILAKLDLEARTQIAVYAIKNGLVTDL